MSLNLRPYQADAVAALRESFRSGKRAPLLVLPTGGGKTQCFAFMTHGASAKGKRVLILAHRKELIKQASRKLSEAGVEHGIVAPGFTATRDPVQVASVQTICRKPTEYGAFDLIVIDECVSGDTLVDTDVGAVAISEIPQSGAKMALSWDGFKYGWRPITAWWSSGIRETISLTLSNGRSVVCTPDHRILIGDQWVKARDVKIGSVLVNSAAFVNVDAERPFSSTSGVISEVSSEGTTLRAHEKTGMPHTLNTSHLPHCATADVESKLSRSLIQSSNWLAYIVARSIQSLFMDTTEDSAGRRVCFQTLSAGAFSGPSLETEASGYQTQEATITGWHGPTVRFRKNGSAIRLRHLPLLVRNSISSPMLDTVTIALKSALHACRAFQKLRLSRFVTDASRLALSGSIPLALGALRGGSAMMDRDAGALSSSTPRDTRWLKFKSFVTGLRLALVNAPFTRMARDSLLSDSISGHPRGSGMSSGHMCQSACPINYLTVTGVRAGERREVFDITVDGTHCFFANGALVHNCHHTVAGQYIAIIAAQPSAKLLGVTATPERGDSRGLGISAGGVFDDIVIGPTVAELIAGEFLTPVRVFAPATGPDLSGVRIKMGDYEKAGLAAVMNVPTLTGEATSHYAKHAGGKPAIAFCVSVDHAKSTAAAFRAAGFRSVAADGSMPPAERDAAIGGLADGSVQVLCSCSLIDEGLDVPAVSAVLLLNPTRSLGRYLQQVGRGLRPAPGKSHLVVLDHAGSTLAHGMPDGDREWSLDGRPKKQQAAPTRQCPECFAIFSPAAACPECGHSFAAEIKEARELEVIAGELEEINAAKIEALRKTPLARLLTGRETMAELLEIQKAKGYKPGWARYVMFERREQRERARFITLERRENRGVFT